MIKLYGRDDCPDCVNCKQNLDANGIEYDFRDIGKSLRNMAVFIKIRDINNVFDSLKGTGSIGIPAIVLEDRTVVLDWEKYLNDNGYTVSQAKSSCSIDGKGC